MNRLLLLGTAALLLAACEPTTERVYQGAVPVQTDTNDPPAAIRVGDGVYVAN